MPITDPLIVPSDVLIVSVNELPPATRQRLAPGPDAFAVTRPRSRVSSKIVSESSAELLREFRDPRRVVDVIAHYARRHDLDPRAVLTDAFPVIRDCYNARLLVPVSAPEARGITASLERGDRVARFEIVRSVQVLADTELYQAKDERGVAVALKIARLDSGDDAAALLAREAKALAHLHGGPVPSLLESGTLDDGAPYLALSWCAGVAPLVVAAEARDDQVSSRTRLAALCQSLATGLAELHRRGVVHGDVQPNNVLIDSTGRVVFLDFGLSRLVGAVDPPPPRSGVAYFLDPQLAAAWADARPPEPATEASDQYQLAALLYLVVTGSHYLDFALEKQPMLRQIIEAPPLPFSRCGVAPWPSVEGVLRRALSKQPHDRFPSAAALGDALATVARPAAPSAANGGERARMLEELVEPILDRLAGSKTSLARQLPAPTASVTFGAGGIAFALYRIACVRNDSASLASADAWAARALRERDAPQAFYDGASITPASVGTVSPYHTVSGVHAVRALIGQAQGDARGTRSAVEQFVAASQGRAPSIDLTLGTAGVLLATSLLVDALPVTWGEARDSLLAFGVELEGSLWERIDRLGSAAHSDALPSLAMAHGWAGVLFALLRWRRSTGQEPPERLIDRLDALAACGEPAGRGMQWPRRAVHHGHVADSGYSAGWCNGSAGFVFLWTEAHRAFGRDYLELARGAAFNVWEGSGRWPSLCCGLIGRAYALLNVFRHTGDAEWLERAQRLTERAAAAMDSIPSPHRETSLYKGELALAVIVADLANPVGARMPFFEDEGWPVSHG